MYETVCLCQYIMSRAWRSVGWARAEVPWWAASEAGYDVVVQLERPGTLEVEVRDESGSPAALAKVWPDRKSDVPSNRWLHDAHTDESGRVRFEAIDPGRYHLTVTRGELKAEADVEVTGGAMTRARVDLRSP